MRYFLRRLSQYFLLFTTVQTVIVDRRGWIWLGSSAFKQNKILASDMCTRNDLLLLFVCFACVRARARARVCVCVCESVRACVRACVCVCVDSLSLGSSCCCLVTAPRVSRLSSLGDFMWYSAELTVSHCSGLANATWGARLEWTSGGVALWACLVFMPLLFSSSFFFFFAFANVWFYAARPFGPTWAGNMASSNFQFSVSEMFSEQEIWRRSTFSFQCPKYISDNEKQQHHQCGDGYRRREQWPLQLLFVHIDKFDAEDGWIAAV